MNLATESWIPVLHKSGALRLVSLRQVFLEGEEYADLAVRTHERIALMRLLICIAQAALDGPKNITEWEKASDRLPKAADEYLRQDYFNLFDSEKPFLQIPDLKASGEQTPVSKLDFSLATGSNTTLFDHGANANDLRSFTEGQMAIMLVTYLNFALGGTTSFAVWNKEKIPRYSKDSPCSPASMYHAFVRCETIKDTIHKNLLTKTAIENFYGKGKWGYPIWEHMPSSFEDIQSVANATETYLGRLVPVSRFILLNKDRKTMVLGNGLPYLSYPEGPREPSSTVVVVQNNARKLLGAGNREIWRELSSLVVKRYADGLGGALTLMNVPEDKDFDLYVGALIRKSGQDEVINTVESVLFVSPFLQTDSGRAVYDSEVNQYAVGIGNRLYQAVETYFKHLSDDWSEKIKREPDPRKRGSLRKQFVAKSTNHYWTSVEKLRPLLLAYVDAIGCDADTVDKSKDTWRSAVHSAARDAYCLACGQETPRQMRAYALGWERLFAQRTENEASDEPDAETIEQE